MSKKITLLFISIITLGNFALASIEDEKKYLKYTNLLTTSTNPIAHIENSHDLKLFVDALWDQADNEISQNNINISCGYLAFLYKQISSTQISKSDESLVDLLRVFLVSKYNCTLKFPSKLKNRLVKLNYSNKFDSRLVHTFINNWSSLQDSFDNTFKQRFREFNKEILNLYKLDMLSSGNTKTIGAQDNYNAIKQVINDSPLDITYKNGKYSNGVRLFVFCRRKRKYPCMAILKDSQNKLVYNQDGSLWHQPVLGAAFLNKHPSKRNGNTPAGVFTIDSVMPQTNDKKTFGSYRRLILNFIKPSTAEVSLKSFLPSTEFEKSWWVQSVMARDNGRNLFRIHGTRKRNRNSFSAHYPFVKTAGCVATREGEYGKHDFKDQRVLLDKMMEAMGLEQKYENEPKIKGHMILMEIDNQKKPVKLTDITSRI